MCTLSPASQIVETLLSAPHAPNTSEEFWPGLGGQADGVGKKGGQGRRVAGRQNGQEPAAITTTTTTYTHTHSRIPWTFVNL